MGFARSRAGACGLEKLGRINKDTKEVQRHRVEPRGLSSKYWIRSDLFPISLHTPTQKEEKTQRTNSTITCFST